MRVIYWLEVLKRLMRHTDEYGRLERRPKTWGLKYRLRVQAVLKMGDLEMADLYNEVFGGRVGSPLSMIRLRKLAEHYRIFV